MSFASKRETTRPEDAAYCLLGLFDVNMPLLYGEGESKAFFRLQEQIMKTSTDLTILAWSPAVGSFKLMASLANSPRDFQFSRDVVSFQRKTKPFGITNKGLQLDLPVIQTSQIERKSILEFLGNAPGPFEESSFIVALPCYVHQDFRGPLCIEISQSSRGLPLPALDEDIYIRTKLPPFVVERAAIERALAQNIFLYSWSGGVLRDLALSSLVPQKSQPFWIDIPSESSLSKLWKSGGLTIRGVPECHWTEQTRVLEIPRNRGDWQTFCGALTVKHCSENPSLSVIFQKNEENVSVSIVDAFPQGQLRSVFEDSKPSNVDSRDFCGSRLVASIREEDIFGNAVVVVHLDLDTTRSKPRRKRFVQKIMPALFSGRHHALEPYAQVDVKPAG
jgi:hypothetical protein